MLNQVDRIKDTARQRVYCTLLWMFISVVSVLWIMANYFWDLALFLFEQQVKKNFK